MCVCVSVCVCGGGGGGGGCSMCEWVGGGAEARRERGIRHTFTVNHRVRSTSEITQHAHIRKSKSTFIQRLYVETTVIRC